MVCLFDFINHNIRRGGFIASALVQHFKLDMQKWMQLIKDLDLLPKIFGTNVSNVFLQKFEGSVTIVPKATLSDYLNLVSDPTRERLEHYLTQGQRVCWPKLCMIKNRLEIEQRLVDFTNFNRS